MTSAARALVIAAAFSGCAAQAQTQWVSTHGRDNPLVGRIYDVGSAAFVTRRQLFDAAAQARFVLLGEQHDNPDHHRLQARVIGELVDRGRAPVVAMEMLDTADHDALAQCAARRRCTAADLAGAVRWEESGWPDWRIYRPVLRAALSSGLRLEPASLPREEVRVFMRTGRLDGRELPRQLDLQRPVEPERAASMAVEIRESHCGYVSESMIDSMVEAQRLRDAYTAVRLLDVSDVDGAILIAGAGHVRTDRGVVERLRAAGTGTVVTVTFAEVDTEDTDVVAYARHFDRPTLPFDYVWFTPRYDDQDPCAKFHEQLERMREKHAQ